MKSLILSLFLALCLVSSTNAFCGCDDPSDSNRATVKASDADIQVKDDSQGGDAKSIEKQQTDDRAPKGDRK